MKNAARQKDIILLTIDCWRYDSPSRMPRLQAFTEDYDRAEATCQAAATNGVFPSILASTYYPKAYDDNGALHRNVRSLPEVLSDQKYATAGVIGSNPYLGKWSDRFDVFWNDSMNAAEESTNRSEYTNVHRMWNLLRLRPRVTAGEVASRGRKWFQHTSSPKFLWMHLMDLHGPYHPGLRRGLETGLFDAFYSIVQHSRHGRDAPSEVLETIRSLYWECVSKLDERIAKVLEFIPEDAIVVIMADHGEELYHGFIGHARLYDECVRVPLFVKNAPQNMDNQLVRQLDLAPSLLDWIDVPQPNDWEGMPHSSDREQASYMINHSPLFGGTFTGIRVKNHKLIKYPNKDEPAESEIYDLIEDPAERNPLSDSSVKEELEDRLNKFLQQNNINHESLTHQTGIGGKTKRRLRELGYL